MNIFAALILSSALWTTPTQPPTQTQAQTLVQLQATVQLQAPPKHFHPGRVLLSDSTLLTGYVRDYIHANATIVFLDARTGAKRSLTGAQLLAVDIDTTRWLCMKGDFFRVIATGDHWVVQKSSNASSRPAFNGAEPILVNGAEGRLNDYFLYDPAAHTLKPVK